MRTYPKKVFPLWGYIAVSCLIASSIIAAQPNEKFITGRHVDGTGKKIITVIVPGRFPSKTNPPAAVKPKTSSKSVKVIEGVPAFDWVYGCSPTAAGMMAGYYDRNGYGNLYTGSVNGGVCPLTNEGWGPGVNYTIAGHVGDCSFVASRKGVDGQKTYGHVDDYWVDYGSDQDPYYTAGREQHTPKDCLADFMGTSQFQNYGNVDGSTAFSYSEDGSAFVPANEGDGCLGIKQFVESKGYSIELGGYFNQLIVGAGTDPAKGFSFDDFKKEIDAGKPVIIQLEGHTVLGFGYDDSNQNIYIHDTWNYLDHQMTWGGEYQSSSGALKQYGVTVIRPVPAGTTSLKMTVTPDGAGTTVPSGTTSTWSIGEEIPISAKAALGWRFSRWEILEGDVSIVDETASSTLIALYANSALNAVFEANPIAKVTMSVSPSGSGSTTPEGVYSVNLNEKFTITTTPSNDEYRFDGWTWSSSDSNLDVWFENLNLTETNAIVAQIKSEQVTTVELTLTANYLKRTSSTGSIKFDSSYSESLKQDSAVTKDKASFTATINVDLTGLAINEDTTLAIDVDDGAVTSSYAMSDAGKKFKYKAGKSGSATFYETDSDDKKTIVTTIKWDNKKLSVSYKINPVPDAGINFLNLYDSVYGKGKKVSLSGTMACAISLTAGDVSWRYVWEGSALSYSGTGKSIYNKKYEDDLVSWSVKGKGSLDQYK